MNELKQKKEKSYSLINLVKQEIKRDQAQYGIN